jgi:hypothetical protein
MRDADGGRSDEKDGQQQRNGSFSVQHRGLLKIIARSLQQDRRWLQTPSALGAFRN